MNTQLATLTAQAIRMTNTIARMEKEKEQLLADYKKSGSSADKWLYKETQRDIFEYQIKLDEKNEKILGIINNDPIYMPSDELKYEQPKLPADLARCINMRDYTGCRGYLNSKYSSRSTTKSGWCPLREHMTSFENKLGKRLIYPEDERDEHDKYGFFFGLDSLYEFGHMNIDRCGVEVAGRKIRNLNVIGDLHHTRKLLIQPETHDVDDQDHTYCWDLSKIKRLLKMNEVKGRSKATTMEKAVKLLMSI